MSRWKLLLVWWVVLAGCESADPSVRGEGSGAEAYGISLDAPAEDLYFEFVRLHSAGVLPPGRMETVQQGLDWVDEHYATAEDPEEQVRDWACPGYVDSRVMLPTFSVGTQAQNPPG